MTTHDELFSLFSRLYDAEKETEMSLEDYLKSCAREPMAYASAAERMLSAIGEPQMIDTSQDTRLGRIFMNRTIRIYPAFQDFYGMEETIERIVGFFRHAAQGLEERKQVLYLLGPVGGGKSSLAERLKLIMERLPIYVLKAGKDMSPVFESPLGLFDPERMGEVLERRYKIPKRRLTGLASPWALKRLDEFGGDLNKFSVVKLLPSRLRQICIAKTEPGDENNQDISSLVGKVDIRKLEFYSQNDADAYSFSGGLNRTTQGILEFVEMFKAPIKMLHPAADGDAGEQLHRLREHRRHSLPGHHPRALQRVRVAGLQEQPQQRGLHRPHLRDQGAVLPARERGGQDLPEAAQQQRALRRALRARHPRHAGAVLRAVAPEAARELQSLLEDAGL